MSLLVYRLESPGHLTSKDRLVIPSLTLAALSLASPDASLLSWTYPLHGIPFNWIKPTRDAENPSNIIECICGERSEQQLEFKLHRNLFPFDDHHSKGKAMWSTSSPHRLVFTFFQRKRTQPPSKVTQSSMRTVLSKATSTISLAFNYSNARTTMGMLRVSTSSSLQRELSRKLHRFTRSMLMILCVLSLSEWIAF